MALALGSDPRTVIGEVARRHGYECLKEEQLSAIKKFVSGQDVFESLPTGFGKSLIYGLLPALRQSSGDLCMTLASVTGHCLDCQALSLAPTLSNRQRCVRSPTCHNTNSSHLTIKTCGCEIITLTPCNERGRNKHCIGKLPDPFLRGVAQ